VVAVERRLVDESVVVVVVADLVPLAVVVVVEQPHVGAAVVVAVEEEAVGPPVVVVVPAVDDFRSGVDAGVGADVVGGQHAADWVLRIGVGVLEVRGEDQVGHGGRSLNRSCHDATKSHLWTDPEFVPNARPTRGGSRRPARRRRSC
jgi:hypothetical protein